MGEQPAGGFAGEERVSASTLRHSYTLSHYTNFLVMHRRKLGRKIERTTRKTRLALREDGIDPLIFQGTWDRRGLPWARAGTPGDGMES